VPFLYLPDAVSLALLITALCLLRRLAVARCLQELHRLRLDLLLYWTDRGLPEAHPAYACLANQMRLASTLSPGVSPSRLFFVGRRYQRIPVILRDRIDEQGPGLIGIEDTKARERLRRIQLEFDISFGTYYLLGSISGWVVTTVIAVRLIRRVARRPADRIGWAFDVMEKTFSRLGRRALRLAYAGRA